MSLLTVEDLVIDIGAARPVDGISFNIEAGECFALLGESGCGKSMTALGLLRLLPAGARISRGQVLFAGNGLAVHDIETALYGTSLGVYIDRNIRASEGHEHHLWAINAVRKAGSIRQAVEQGLLTRGIFYTCVQKGVDFVLAGSIRDDGPLPDVVTDILAAQDLMRTKVVGVRFALMMATTLHAIATGNLLPASVKTVCVDINPAVVTKLTDRGTFQAMGLVTDVEPFLRELCQYL